MVTAETNPIAWTAPPAGWAGVAITSVGGHPIPTRLGYPITIAWLVLCANAMNLIDGLDGLAAGLGLVAAVTMFASAVLQGNDALALATASHKTSTMFGMSAPLVALAVPLLDTQLPALFRFRRLQQNGHRPGLPVRNAHSGELRLTLSRA